MPAPESLPLPLAIVDLETTGGNAGRDRITEIAIIRVDADGVTAWSSLVNPGVPIPPFITRLTGISADMVATAPCFEALVPELLQRLDGARFVAHNARFDHGFLRNAFARAGVSWRAKPLCTVRLSRALDPEAPRHGLDQVIARYGIAMQDRHRALDDARAVLDFLVAAEQRHGPDRVAEAAGELVRRSVLPPYLDADLPDRLPSCPGVYQFHGESGLLYVGKAVNLRQRVLSHFSADHANPVEMRLSQQVRRVTWETCPGELGALLREARLVKQLQPLHNRQLRKQRLLLSLRLARGDDGLLRPEPVSGPSLAGAGRLHGLFHTRAAITTLLRDLGRTHALCDQALGLEKLARRACTSRQLKRCAGLCTGDDSIADHNARLQAALADIALKAWPFDGPVGLVETHPDSGEREIHVVDNWCWLGSVGDEAALADCLAAARDPVLDRDTYRLLVKAVFGSSPLPVLTLSDGRGRPGTRSS